MRYWLPLLAALGCLIAASRISSPIVAFVLIVLAFGLVIEVSTKLLQASGRSGRLTDHRQ